MKRTCEGCKGLFSDQYFYVCQLGYKIDFKKGKPLENCPKPTTNMKLCDAKKKEAMKL
jgi:hypothetical protein